VTSHWKTFAFIMSLTDRKSIYEDHPTREEVHRPLFIQTIHGYVRTMRAFSIWLEEEGYTEANVFKRRKTTETAQVIIKPRDEDKIR
jgi:hypothetical protein